MFMTAAAVMFSFAVMSCSGNKATNAASEGDATTIETVEAAAIVEGDSCCQADSTACCEKKAECAEKKADCAEKKECCDKKK